MENGTHTLKMLAAELSEPANLFCGEKLPENLALPDNILLFHHDWAEASPNAHYRYTVVVPLGRMTYLIEQQRLDVNEGGVLFIAPEQVRYLHPGSPCYARLFITFELPGRQSYLPQGVVARFGGESEKILREIIALFQKRDMLRCAFRLVEFLLSLEAEKSPEKSREFSPLAARCIAYINRHLAENLSVNGIAGALKVSGSNLRMIFRRETGISIGRYIMRQRLSRAKHLLAATRMSVEEIAGLCGYASLISFSLFFKRNSGVSPLNFRRMKG
ncbi:MAG: helix-turn-helix transcriptional regulator [Lentisphaeria bacterium]|nr:helix-turn-helix transcriptional regulator [Lentisphaeria bacterium]